jgi:hypothetical protein
MSERTVTSGSPSGPPPTVPPTVPPARTAGQPSGPPQRVSTTSTRVTGASAEAVNPTTERPASKENGVDPRDKPAGKQKPPGPRRVRLAVSRVDPWSVMKLAFLLSIAVGIGIVVATATVWQVLNQMEVFAEIESVIDAAEARNQFGAILQYLKFSRVLSVATVVAVADIVLMTALATLGAFVYNLVAAMVGGLHLTLTDD